MATVYYDPEFDDPARRARLYAGDIVVYSPCKAGLEFAEFTRALCQEAFGALAPESAQHSMDVDAYAALLGDLKPRFIRDERSAEYCKRVLTELGCAPQETYFDVPRLRTSTSDGYLTTGIAFAWHPHRDTWYSAPPSQLNWWIPVWPIRHDNTMCFYPHYFQKPVPNDSARYNYYTHNAQHRGPHVAKMTKADARAMPGPTEPIDTSSELRLVVPVGAVIVFSGAQLHASVENTSGLTRFSLDFRTVNREDARAKQGAPKVDVHCGGSAIRDYRSMIDGEQLPEEIVELYHDADVEDGQLVFGG
jgi:hypothetical protein